MATEKTFAVAGVSVKDGKTKVRFANDQMRIKILAKNGHTDIELIDLPRAMTKGEIAQYMLEIDFAKGRAEVAAAIAYVAKKNPLGTTTLPAAAAPAADAANTPAEPEAAADGAEPEAASDDAAEDDAAEDAQEPEQPAVITPEPEPAAFDLMKAMEEDPALF